MSGVGFESGGLGAAHAIQKGLTYYPELSPVYHGDKVAFCLIVQLVMENGPKQEFEDVVNFMIAVDLPVCFEDLGVPDITDEMIQMIAKNSTHEWMTIHNMPFTVNENTVYLALKKADSLGRSYRKLK